jgi:serine/threonine protein kinase
VIEWVAPEDKAISEFHHIQWNADTVTGAYDVDAFETSLRKHFGRVEILGATSPTRIVYAAHRGRNEVTISGDLPLLHPRQRVISSRTLVEHQGVRYHSRVYQGTQPRTIEKQTTGELATHEEAVLRRLTGPHFPRALSARQADGYSVLTMERIEGELLVSRVADVAPTPGTLARFYEECLDILGELQAAGVRHRDLRLANLMVRDGRPVLIDFGWAELGGEPFLTPPGLGASTRPPDGAFCDVYSMGCTFTALLPRGSKLFAPLVGAMTAAPGARVTDVAALRTILKELTKELPPSWDVPPSFAVTPP